jgi:broad specificity phosphatase PhoE
MTNPQKRQCILYFIRHGQTDWNAEKRLQGHIDIPLNEVGKSQAGALAEELKTHPITAIYSSPLQRAYATAQKINEPHGHEIKIHPGLIEASYGSKDGTLVADYHRDCKRVALSKQERLHFKLVPDEESYFEVYQRATGVLEEIIQNHPNGTVLVVTHGNLMRSIIGMLTEIDVLNITIHNGAWMKIKADGAQLSILEYQRVEFS